MDRQEEEEGGGRGAWNEARKERKVWKRAQPGGLSGVKRESGSGAGHTGLNAVL